MVAPIPRCREVWTGRTRSRPFLFGLKFVTQVQVRVESHEDRPVFTPDGFLTRADWIPLYTKWRDATWDDMQAISEAPTAKEVIEALIACHEEPDCAAVEVAKGWLKNNE